MDPVLDLVLRAGLALLFLAAARHKLRDPRAFVATVRAYRLGPPWTAPFSAGVVVTAELAVPLLLGVARTAGLLAAAALLLAYAGAIGINLARGRRDLDCGCFGPAVRRPIGGGLVARNLALAAVALAGLAPLSARAWSWVDGGTAAAATIALAACWTAADRLLALAPALARLRLETRT
jgi:hypothetical protein